MLIGYYTLQDLALAEVKVSEARLRLRTLEDEFEKKLATLQLTDEQ